MKSSILSLLALDQRQREAVACDADVLVTAGAGSGKTRTLVARYLTQLEAGAPLRSLIAITFTDKAAREMRTRIRQLISEWLTHPANPERARWEEVYAELDAARIGTIHSLCAAILRLHPAEAGVDPAFEVLDENAAAALRAQAIENALGFAANDADAATLFALLKENALREILAALLEKRLDARAAFDAAAGDPGAVWRAALARALAEFMDGSDVRDAMGTLRQLRDDDELAADAGDKLAAQIARLLVRWARIESAYAARDWGSALPELFALRREDLGGGAGRAGAAKGAVRILRDCYDATLDDWLGGKNAGDAAPRWSLDERAVTAMPQLRRAFDAAEREYDALKAERAALDFDDLEAQTVALLETSVSVRAQWQAQTRAVLMDEFQDTNDRQRRIVYALSEIQNSKFERLVPHSNLFVVGDGKQSIYRFRGGDVIVWRRAQSDIVASSGVVYDLNMTYRAHAPLVAQLNALLEPILGTTDDPARPYAIPFAPLRAHRSKPRDKISTPFVEFWLGIGEDAAQGRAAAAAALAARLQQMHAAREIAWGDVGLLFRAANYADYESAFEHAHIPFVTVAGKGFYERPEVRDLLNALAAIADPTDDLAMAGVLRSPAFALTDGTLYLLRRSDATWSRGKRSFWSALQSDLAALAPEDAARAVRAREILRAAIALAGRVSVAAVLKYLLDATDYRAILRWSPGGERPRRNVDKLLADAHASGLVSLREFLEYVQTLRDVEAREGEAPVEAGEAVQLMTVHKAKGLEFPVVVIADAAHSPRGARRFWLDAELGPVYSVREGEERSVMDRLAARRDADQADAEERRLLYVAATRAKEKLIVSGHTKRKKDGTLLLGGWLEQLGARVGLDTARVPEEGEWKLENGDWRLEVRDWGLEDRSWTLEVGSASPISNLQSPTSNLQLPISNLQPPNSNLPSLLAPIVAPTTEDADDKTRAREAEPPPRVWRVVPTAQRPRGPAWVVGALVHQALRRWRFPDAPDFDVFLYPHALAAGLTDRVEITATLNEVRRLLMRLQAHELFREMDAAKRYHELPFTWRNAGRVEAGVIDVLYRKPCEGSQPSQGWWLVDFKTDEIRDEETLNAKIAEYREQVTRYAAATQTLVGAMPETRLCFLDVRGQVRVVNVV
jgi:ATP-dependent helicase/nuclease subunit A